MSAITRMERFVRDLNYTKSGHTGGVRVRYARPWQTVSPPLADYVIEIGDTPYGKKGTWKQELSVGVFQTGRLRQVASEVKASNPELFTDGVYLRQVMKK
jgi:hypothetical protein|tara:strand:- start:126 stop:425 length:300 start_codon:yes stop_codon:yes gene_type:complete